MDAKEAPPDSAGQSHAAHYLRGTIHVYTHFAAGRSKEACKLCESMSHGRTQVNFGCPACGFPFRLECFNAYHIGVTLNEICTLKHMPN